MKAKLKQSINEVSLALKKRGVVLDVDEIQSIQQKRVALITAHEGLLNQKKSLSKSFGIRKKNNESVDDLSRELDEVKASIEVIEHDLLVVQQAWEDCVYGIPNAPHASVPNGLSEEENVIESSHGTHKNMDFSPMDHTELSKQIDMTLGAKLVGSRFAVMRSKVAKLHRAIAQFMLNTHEQFGYEEVNTPVLASSPNLLGTGQLPKFKSDQFKIEGEDWYLIPTAEVTLTNLFRGQMLMEEALPQKLMAHTLCFRKEAGSYGKDTKGMFRVHQFEKVELVQVVHPDVSYDALDGLLLDARRILDQLELPYQVVNLCGGDLGFSAAKTYDLEVWLPSQQRYREVSSCSNFEAFQAERMELRFKNSTGKKEHPHTLNGSGLAVGRTLIAVLENYQQADGSIIIPKVLVPLMGCELIEPN